MKAFRISVKMTALAAILLASLMVVGISGAWAHGGGNMMGPGYQGRGYGGMMGPGWQGRGYAGWGPASQLSKEDLEKINQLHADFWKKSADLRRKMYQKRLTLSIELSKEKPSENNALKIEDALSGLRARLARMRIEHLFAMRKINPQFGAACGLQGQGYQGRGYGGWGGMMMGPGMMGGGMMMGPGYGGRGYGGWNGMMGPWNGPPPSGNHGTQKPAVKQ